MIAVFDLRVSSTQKLVLLALADHANLKGGSCYPSIRRLMQKTSLSERSLQRALQELVASGVIRIEREATPRAPRVFALTYFQEPGSAGPPAPFQSGQKSCPGRLRRRVLEAFAQVCEYCRQPGSIELGPDGQTWTVDRITPAALGGLYAAANVTLACATCNRRKGGELPLRPTRSLAFLEAGLRGVTVAPLVTRGANLADQGCQAGGSGVPNLPPLHKPLVEPSRNPASELADVRRRMAASLTRPWNTRRRA